MISAIFDQPSYVAAKKMMDATLARHEAIASNLANLETPGYKRMDLAPSFAQALQSAVGSGSSAQIAGLTPTLAVDTTALAHTRDGNTVRLETELAALIKNTTEHSLETQILTGAMARLRLAITGRSA